MKSLDRPICAVTIPSRPTLDSRQQWTNSRAVFHKHTCENALNQYIIYIYMYVNTYMYLYLNYTLYQVSKSPSLKYIHIYIYIEIERRSSDKLSLVSTLFLLPWRGGIYVYTREPHHISSCPIIPIHYVPF